MLRTTLCSAAAALGFTLTGAATAHPPTPVPYPQYPSHYPPPVRPVYPSYRPSTPILPGPVCRTWKVLHRHGDHEPWCVYGVYRDDDDARRVARHLRRSGDQVRVVSDRGPVY